MGLFEPASPRAETAFFTVVHGSSVHRVQIRRVAQARRFTLRVRAATRDAVLTMPPRGSLTHARAFVERHAGWIEARLKRLPAPAPFGSGSEIPLRGIPHRITHKPAARGTVWVETADDETMPLLCVSGDAPFVARRVRDYLRNEARKALHEAVARHTAALGLDARSITIRDTRSRWGSCSSTGALSFSWRLILAPPAVLDYLAAHEVAHLKEMNHSPAFWRVVERLLPDYGRAEAWLKANGTGLMRFGATAEGP